MSSAELNTRLNECRPPQYARIVDLRPGVPYRVVQLNKAKTRLGETIRATLEGLLGDDTYLSVYLPARFMNVLSEEQMESYNLGEGERLSLQYRGFGKGVEFV